jgi:uncharacterized protein
MKFEFDEVKNQSNKLKHGIDFVQAQSLWEDLNFMVIPAKTVDEPRFVIIAQIGTEMRSGIYTLRNEVVRIISVRKSRQNEKKIYQR